MSLFAGKLAFRDFQFITKSYGITVVDGYVLLRYWRRKYRKHASETTSPRLQLQLNGFALHSYNRVPAYAHINDVVRDLAREDASTRGVSTASVKSNEQTEETAQLPGWMKIFPVIRVGIRAGRWVVGNHTLPTVLTTHFRRGSFCYAWEDAPLDPYIWLLDGKLTQLKVNHRGSYTCNTSPLFLIPPDENHLERGL